MDLKSRIRIIYFICFCLALAIVLIFITAIKQVDKYTVESQYSFEIIKEGNDLNATIFNYVADRKSLTEILNVINTKHQVIMDMINRFAPQDAKYRKILDSISSENNKLHEMFLKMIEHGASARYEGTEPEAYRDTKLNILREITSASHNMNTKSLQLQNISIERVRITYVRAYIMILICVGVIIFFIDVILVMVKKTFAEPIMKLKKGTEIVGAGNLEHKISNTATDEIGQLSRAFDQMTERLRTITVSHDELEKVIIRRTSDLTAANKKLKEEAAERKQAEYALRESEEMYRDLFENANDLIQSISPDGRLIYANHSWHETLGYGKEDILNISIFDIIHPDCRDQCREVFQKVLNGDKIDKVEATFMTKDGREILLEGSVSCKIVDGVPIATRGIFRDITERKILEGQLRQAQKMEAVGRLAGGIAHDFNNLLTAIMGYSDLIMAQVTQDEFLKKRINEIQKATDRASSLVNRLLAFSRRQTLEAKALLLNNLIKDMDPMFRRLISENILLKTDLRQDIGYIKADPGQLEQVILNLVINARDAMTSGGTLTIRTGSAVIDKEFTSENPGSQEGKYVTLVVADTGCGMNKETQAQLFEPFFTTKEPGQGTGLGLSIVYGIVKQSGGYITVSSSQAEGTTITIYLPRHEGQPEPLLVPEEAAESKNFRGTETILVVEDEESVLTVSGEALVMSGYTVLNACNAEEALKICSDRGKDIHLVVTDVVMPGMNGLDLSERLVSDHPAMKVLLVSGYSYDTIGRQGILDPGTPFLHKPYKIIELLKKVRAILDDTPEE